MLTEIYCDKFGATKHISFGPGLNVIQGVGGNSIGKSTMLKIIDYAFGGRYYAQSNDDILKKVGEHDICFSHVFQGQTYYFRRSASSPTKIIKCSDYMYAQGEEIPIASFSSFLLENYGLSNRQVSFRDLVSLYSRIWSKENRDVKHPLYQYRGQAVSASINQLIKLFNYYSPLHQLSHQVKDSKNHEKAIKIAAKHNLRHLPSASEAKKLKRELDLLEEQITQQKANITFATPENSFSLNSKTSCLLANRSSLLQQQGRVLRRLRRLEQELANTFVPESSTFDELFALFPNIDKEKLSAIESFHCDIQHILNDGLMDEKNYCEMQLNNINSAIEKNESKLRAITGLPSASAEAIDNLLTLSKRKSDIQAQLRLYDDVKSGVVQRKADTVSLDALYEKTIDRIQEEINSKIASFSAEISTSNSKPPSLELKRTSYAYGVTDNTGTGKAYTDLILFDLAILALTDLPFLIHDSFLFNNIDSATVQNFIRIYNRFTDKQVFISLDQYLGADNADIDAIIKTHQRLTLSDNLLLFGQDWRR